MRAREAADPSRPVAHGAAPNRGDSAALRRTDHESRSRADMLAEDASGARSSQPKRRAVTFSEPLQPVARAPLSGVRREENPEPPMAATDEVDTPSESSVLLAINARPAAVAAAATDPLAGAEAEINHDCELARDRSLVTKNLVGASELAACFAAVRMPSSAAAEEVLRRMCLQGAEPTSREEVSLKTGWPLELMELVVARILSASFAVVLAKDGKTRSQSEMCAFLCSDQVFQVRAASNIE